eukprot:CFRG8454T1
MVDQKNETPRTDEDVESVERDLVAHKAEFEAIVKRYELFHEDRAGIIADFLTTLDGTAVSPEEFGNNFGMNRAEAIIFLSWINVGLTFKTEHLDKNKDAPLPF